MLQGDELRSSLNITAHGRHIASLILGNLYVACPDLILSGRVYIVIPPDYGVTYVRSKALNNKWFYFRTADDLLYWMCQHVYREALDIRVSYEDTTVQNYLLEGQHLFDFVRVVQDIGDKIGNLASSLALNPLVLETLTHISHYLTPQTMDVQVVKDRVGCDQVIYDPQGNILILSIAGEDYTIPLQDLQPRVHAIIKYLRAIAWNRLYITVTTHHTDTWQDLPVSLYQLHEILTSFEKMFRIKKYKGLGGMDPRDKYKTCMDPHHRMLYQITSLEDVQRLYDLLGVDSDHRKQLLHRPLGSI